MARAQVLLLCTGYNYTFSYLRGEAAGLDIRKELVTPLYRFLLPPACPSLFIIGVCKLILPFPHFHCQVTNTTGITSWVTESNIYIDWIFHHLKIISQAVIFVKS